ncbi:MAG: YhfC family intramembrane metalloprotease [Candidatus Diapherotrites archaeon]|uniref:YhfC family intramembrane metalloprotease n=1 Tax=Candidatus Iainarchaeum sp. TaxID=3101447 RepID=A0A8T4L6N1_9ARCH|nr:YhfC family intramembrane metalloprotease [Candidatus Diapherotrites archaeon]
MDPVVLLTFGIVALLEILIPLALGFWIVKKYHLSWKVFGLGLGFFILVQVLHVPFVFLTQTPLSGLFSGWFEPPIPLVLSALYLGLLAGLFEEIGRWLVFKYVFQNQKVSLSRENGLLFGVGWGGVECMLIGVILIVTAVGFSTLESLDDAGIADLNQQSGGTLTQEQVDQIKQQQETVKNLTPVDALPGLLERLLAMGLHLSFSLLVFRSIVESNKIWLILAIVLHSLVDAVVVYLAQTAGLFEVYGALMVFVAVSAFFGFKAWNALKSTALA